MYFTASQVAVTLALQIVNGTLRVRQSPGLGIEIDEDKLARYRQGT
jgi:L-alanine-DL-glutamate epimerase-like enolase superfamily enzyme